MSPSLTIGRIAAAADCKVRTVRYYEQIGLLSPPSRSDGNQRLYREEDASRLSFIRHARELGFSIDAIRDLLGLADDPEQSCAAVDSVARAQLAHVERSIAHLQAMKVELERMLKQCGGGNVSTCRIIEVLADHSQCVAPEHRSVVSAAVGARRKEARSRR